MYIKGVRFRLYPNEGQKNLLARMFGCVRLVYNLGIDLREEAHAKGEYAGYKETAAMIVSLKNDGDHDFLKEADSISLQQTLRDLDKAYMSLFDHKAGHPKFKSKYEGRQSYRTMNQNDHLRIEDRKHIRLPKIGVVKFRQSMDVGKTRSATVERDPDGRYYVVLLVECEDVKVKNAGGLVGLDMGTSSFLTDSNGAKVGNPRYQEKAERKLAREQRRLSRKDKGSNNREKQRLRVAVAYRKANDKRTDFLQKESTKLVSENQVICVESLDVRGMMKKPKRDPSMTPSEWKQAKERPKHIASASWSSFFGMIDYKGKRYGCKVVHVPRYFASSQICNDCHAKNPAVKDERIRHWKCPVCGAEHDRDINAANNILEKGLDMMRACP